MPGFRDYDDRLGSCLVLVRLIDEGPTGGVISIMTVSAMLRHPSAFVPLVMSLGALVMILWFVAAHGTVRQPDESAQARIWQILMAAQLPVIAYFALRWLPRETRPAGIVLSLQLIAAVLAAAPVFLLGF